jgi:hypothetical protein
MLYDSYEFEEARKNFRSAIQWHRARKYYVALAKTYLPKRLAKIVRGTEAQKAGPALRERYGQIRA